MSPMPRNRIPSFDRSWTDPQVMQRRSLRLMQTVLTYVVLGNLAFVFLFPIIYMLLTSFKTRQDLNDVTIIWLPRTLHWDNYAIAFELLDYFEVLKNSLVLIVPTTIGQVLTCSLVGYGFARVRFPGREVLFLLVMFSFIIPPQTIIVPHFIMYRELDWFDTYYPLVLPAFLGVGPNAPLFILVFRQFFRTLPWELEDAGMIDGAGLLRVYWQIMLPLARPAVLVVLLFALVWQWNDVYTPGLVFRSEEFWTLPMQLFRVKSLSQRDPMALASREGATVYNEAIGMAATFLEVLPLLIMYLFVQRYFVESIDRTGLVE